MKTKARQQSKERHLNPKHWGSVLELYRACLNNAIDLAKEAELLYQHEHYARAVALSLIAIEEIGKSQIVADFFNEMVSSSELGNAFKKHEVKSAYNFRKFVLNNMTIEYNPSDGRKYHKWRMESIYVDYSEDYKPQEPKKQFTKEDARKSIDFVQKEIKDILQMEYITERIGSKSFMK